MVRRARAPTGRTTRRARSDASTTPQRDEATGEQTRQGSGAPSSGYAGMKMPHERDESAEQDTGAAGNDAARAKIAQGATDVEQGQRDTDCYNATAPRYQRQQRKRG